MDSALQLGSKPQSQLIDSNFTNDPESVMIQNNVWIRGIFPLKSMGIFTCKSNDKHHAESTSFHYITYHTITYHTTKKYCNPGTHRTMKKFYIDPEG